MVLLARSAPEGEADEIGAKADIDAKPLEPPQRVTDAQVRFLSSRGLQIIEMRLSESLSRTEASGMSEHHDRGDAKRRPR